MSVVFQILTLLGSLGLFLYGMTLMSEALQKVAGERLRSTLTAMTSNRFKGIFTGFFITSIIQSSSATTVMIVSFVNAGLLTLYQAVGVIMGANIGTTVTAWLISLLGFKFDIAVIAIPLIAVGFVFMMFKSRKRKSIGEMIIGFALLFMGLGFMKEAVPDLNSSPEVLAFIQRWTDWGFWSILAFVGLGTALTIILQSSSATMALTLVMCNFGWIPFEMAAAMVLGENIGTTVTANIAAAVGNVSAKRAAIAHTVFNIFGVIWVLILFKPFLWLVSKIIIAISGIDPFLSTESVLYGVSMVHTLFNVSNALILVWFIPQIVKIVEHLIPSPKGEEVFRLQYIQGGLLNTAELSLAQAKNEILHFAQIIQKEYKYVREAINEVENQKKFQELFAKIEKYEQITDNIEVEIAKYLNSVNEWQLSDESKNRVQAMYKIISEMESIGDSGFNIARILQRKNDHKKIFERGMLKKLNKMMDLVEKSIEVMMVNLELGYTKIDNISSALDLEYEINEYRNNLKDEHLINLDANEYAYLVGVYYIDIISELEKAGDYAINVSEAIIEIK